MQEKVKLILDELEKTFSYRDILPMRHDKNFIYVGDKRLVNFSSNDYLGIAQSKHFTKKFFDQLDLHRIPPSSSSSRILTGSFEIFERFEYFLQHLYAPKKALLFNSGYHANMGAIDCLARISNTLFLTDSSMHASVFDGLRISHARFKRFAHNNMQDLGVLLEKYHREYDHIVILSEGIFSMDGDVCDIKQLVEFKKQYPNVLLYIDEAHSIGTYGKNLLGVCKNANLIEMVDFLILGFGKAIGSSGGCVICDDVFRKYFINKARTLIYSTAMAPTNIAFSLFVFQNLLHFKPQQKKLLKLAKFLKQGLRDKNIDFIGDVHIICLMTYDNKKTLELSQKLFDKGFFAPAIRFPSVPENQSRIRISLTANLTQQNITNLLECL
ncbi:MULTISPECIES: aminotransferase class I/II-fold pyridoxal phosphate-dependent enzyme [unclassified Helicobacter]|uniref:aminotransferase class I/II-fold pyridoxal phosphate-dependent enzyme n=1 Tax=unclassified Helicobacter TaxID=2593540 RepID=UPI000CF07BE9|nr:MULTISPECIES: pyridoxal phosphate-dependent aminotransferase family protein [unclassified Helicobacter]